MQSVGKSWRWGYNGRLTLGLLFAGVLLVVFCSVAEWYIENESSKMLADMQPLAQSLELQDWDGAVQNFAEVAEHWQKARGVWLGLLSHREVWTIDEALIGLGAFVEERKSEDAKERLALVEYYLERSRESDDLNWHNFF